MFDENIVVASTSGLCFQFRCVRPDVDNRGIEYVPIDMRSVPMNPVGSVVRLTGTPAAAEKIKRLRQDLATQNRNARTWVDESAIPGRGPTFARGALEAAWTATVTRETIKFLQAFQNGTLPVRGEEVLTFIPGGVVITTPRPDRDPAGPVQALGKN